MLHISYSIATCCIESFEFIIWMYKLARKLGLIKIHYEGPIRYQLQAINQQPLHVSINLIIPCSQEYVKSMELYLVIDHAIVTTQIGNYRLPLIYKPNRYLFMMTS